MVKIVDTRDKIAIRNAIEVIVNSADFDTAIRNEFLIVGGDNLGQNYTQNAPIYSDDGNLLCNYFFKPEIPYFSYMKKCSTNWIFKKYKAQLFIH